MDLIKAHPVPTPCCGQGCHPSAQAAQGPIQPGLEHFQVRDTLSFSGQLCHCLTALLVKNFFLKSNLNLPSFTLKPLPLVLSVLDHVQSWSPSSFKYWKAVVRSSGAFSSPYWTSPAFSIFPHRRGAPHLWASSSLLWTNISESSLCWCSRPGHSTSGGALQGQNGGGQSPPSPCWPPFFWWSPGYFWYLGCKCTHTYIHVHTSLYSSYFMFLNLQ
mgnify:CR=1 FL=1